MNNEDHMTNSADGKFNSYSIGRKEKVDYFSKNQPKPRKKIRDWKIFKGKNKFILLGIILAVILIIVLCWYFFSYLPNKPIEVSPEEKAFQESSMANYEEALALAGDSKDNLPAVMTYLNDSADRLESPNEQLVVKMIMTDIYWQFNMYAEALNYLQTMDLSDINDYTMADYYDKVAFTYDKLGDQAAALESRYKAYELRGIRPETLEAIQNEEPTVDDYELMEEILNGRY